MDIEKLQSDWEELGRTDPLWAIMTSPGKQGGKWDLQDFLRTGEREIGRVMEHMASLGLEVRREEALDFGCGVGRLTQALADHFGSVVGVDIAEPMIDQARRLNRHGDRCTYVVNTAPDLAMFADGAFDFVYSNITLQHMPQRYMRRYLAEFIRVLDPKGIIVFELTERPPLSLLLRLFASGVRRAVVRRSGVMRMYWMRRPLVESFLQRHGARVIDVRQTFADRGWVRLSYSVVRTPER